MIGIYKITNLINGHCYIGQSVQIQRRWKDHRAAAFNENSKAYQYPLYRAIRKYGLENFSFEVIEECSQEKLDEKEIYWIKNLNPVYNQTEGADFHSTYSKLTLEQVQEIQKLLIEDKEGLISHTDLADKYNVHRDTIRDINVGRSWFNENLSYPLHYSKFDARKPKIQKVCSKCGKEIYKYNESGLCLECYKQQRKEEAKNNSIIDRETLKNLIRTKSFVQIGLDFKISDNAVRKWCDKFNLPRTKKEINSYSDEEWSKI